MLYLSRYPKPSIKSDGLAVELPLTYDNGKEFSGHARIDEALGSTGYFARPFASLGAAMMPPVMMAPVSALPAALRA